MGSSARRAPDPAKNPAQSTAAPRAHSPAAASTAARASSRPRRSAGSHASPSAAPGTSGPRPHSTPSGPISTRVRTPRPRSPATAAANRTGSRACRTQYPGSVTCPGAGAPVSAETSGTPGSWYRTDAVTRPNASSMGSISGEWNAWLTRSGRTRAPAAASAAAAPATAAASPETTTDAGPFTTATTAPGQPASTSRTWSSAASTAVIAPPGGSSCISRPRAATTLHASRSDHAPATCAAASSPAEWPATACGTIPHEASSRDRATCTANRPACAHTVSSAARLPASSTAAATDPAPPRYPSRYPHASSKAPAKTGNAACSPAPIPARCAPCPENTNATFPAAPPRPGGACATAASPASSSSRSPPTTAARSSSAARVTASDQPTSAAPSPGRAATCSASRPACAASPSRPRPDTSHGTAGSTRPGPAPGTAPPVPGAPPPPGAGGSPSSAGGSSRIRCALVPLIPNDDTPARRTRSPAGQGTGPVSSRTAPACQSTCGDGSSACSVRGSSWCRSAMTTLITPAIPAAACACPMFDFTDPSHSGRPSSRPCP